MPELREVFEMTTKHMEPDSDAWRKQEERQRRSTRNKKIGTYAVVAAILLAAIAVILEAQGERNATTPANQPTPEFTRRDSPHEVSIVGLDGTIRESFPALLGDAFAPSLSPDGTTFAFVTTMTGYSQIATMSASGDVKVLTDMVDAESPVWSPDGSRLAFMGLNVDGNYDVYIVDADGRNLRDLTKGDSADDQTPEWSPDGSRLVYIRNPTTSEFSKRVEIWVVPTDGGASERLTVNDVWDGDPTWSPDGSQIAFMRVPEHRVWVMDADGGHQHPLTGRLPSGYAPQWSPDGSRISYLRFEDFSGVAVFKGGAQQAATLGVYVVDIASGQVTDLHVRVVSDLQRARWLPSGDGLVVDRLLD